MNFKLPELSYSYDALEPFIDKQTMEIHHTKHHATYVEKLNDALEKHPEIAEKPLEDLLKNLNDVPDDIRGAVRNHGGGHFNHSVFWKWMTPPPVSRSNSGPTGKLVTQITESFGDFFKFKEQFTSAAVTLFGSGWAWLVRDGVGKLFVMTTQNQDNPISKGFIPLLGLDVWEHAYYLKYQNKRVDYINAWWNVVNWEAIN